LALAVFTAGLAVVTSRAVHWTRKAAEATEALAKHAAEETDAAERQVAATVKVGEASIRPWLTTDPTNTLTISPDLGEGQSVPSVSLRVRNVGAGLALVVPQQTYMQTYMREYDRGQLSLRLRTLPSDPRQRRAHYQ